jgi:hypothetical protein
MDVHEIPIPPPWVFENGVYYNDVTGEETTTHPLKRLMDAKAAAEGPSSEENTSSLDKRELVSSLDSSLEYINTALIETQQEEMVPATNMDHTQREGKNASGDDEEKESAPVKIKRAPGLRYFDFRCLWRETSLFGEINSYGLTVRWYMDRSVTITFDGLEGKWDLSHLEGLYGPIERIDLFVGAKLNIFGRKMSINSCGASTCKWIEDEGQRLKKQQNWLQERVESVGKVPVVRRPPPKGPLQNSGRGGRPAGSDDLRRMTTENSKLLEQLAKIGMGHCVPPPYYTKEHRPDS